MLRALRSGWLTTGPLVSEFETAFVDYIGAPAAVAVNSCTAALHIALASMGVGLGDAVITTTLTFCSTVHVIEELGAHPVLVDVDPATLTIDPGAVERVLEELEQGLVRDKRGSQVKAKALLPVHYAGLACDMDSLNRIARSYSLDVVEDAAHALPTGYQGELVGGHFDPGIRRAVAFSFYPTKNITTGEGGMLATTPEIADEARIWALHGMTRDAWKRYAGGGQWRYDVVRPGFKYNMTDLQAALGITQLGRLDEFHRRRTEIALRYLEGLAPVEVLEMPPHVPGISHAWHLFVVRLRPGMLAMDRDGLIDRLAERGVGTSVHFIPVHTLSYYRDTYGYREEDLPIAYRSFKQMISLPIYPAMTEDDVDYVIASICEIAEDAESAA